jgi:hypothetical protein
LAFVRADFIPLNVLLTAMNGGVPDPGCHNLADPLPVVLPGGVAWHEVLPAVISWLDSADRTADMAEARAAWKAAMKRWWAGEQSSTADRRDLP